MLNTNRYSRSIAIDYLKNKFRDENVKVVYVYFDYKSQQDQTAFHTSGNLLKQLISQSQSKIPQDLETLYSKHIRTDTKPDQSTLNRLLASLSQEFFSIYVVFDALDECLDECSFSHKQEVLELFSHLQNSRYRLLISFRPCLREQHLSDRLAGATRFEIRANESDLTNYITKRLMEEENKSVQLTDGCLKLVEAAQGM